MEECLSEVWENKRARVSLGKATFKYLQSGYFKIKSVCGQDKACSPQLIPCVCQVQEQKTPLLGLVDPNTKQNVKCYYYQRSSWTLESSSPGFKAHFCYFSSDEALIGTCSEPRFENLQAGPNTRVRALPWGSHDGVKCEMPGTVQALRQVCPGKWFSSVALTFLLRGGCQWIKTG